MFGIPGTSIDTYAHLIEEDRQLVDALESCGADLNQPRHVLHYVECRTETMAIRMSELGADWDVSISPPTEDDDTWFVVFERSDRVLTATNILSDRHLFEMMASVHRSTYEGWEASV